MQNPIQKFFEKPGIVSENLKTLTSSNYPRVGVRTIAPEKYCPPRLGLGFGLGLALKLGLGAIFLGGNYIFCWNFTHISYLPMSSKGCSGFFYFV